MSKASSTFVMPEVRIRACHVHGSFITKDNRKPPFSLTQARNAPQRDTSRIVPPPASFAHERDWITRRWSTALDYIRTHDLNEVFDGDLSCVGCGHRGEIATAAMLWVRRPREAALKDEAGHARDNPMKAVASFPNERAAA